MASDIAGLVAQHAFKALKGPIEMVTAPHSPVPFSAELEDLYIPGPDKIEAAVRRAMAN
jgi:pyruvate dehydrogenase E1 component beta subunit